MRKHILTLIVFLIIVGMLFAVVGCAREEMLESDEPDELTVAIISTHEIGCGNSHSLALQEDGTVWAWGWNPRGLLGDGTTEERLTPVKILINLDPGS